MDKELEVSYMGVLDTSNMDAQQTILEPPPTNILANIRGKIIHLLVEDKIYDLNLSLLVVTGVNLDTGIIFLINCH
jgi:hypothetical protein